MNRQHPLILLILVVYIFSPTLFSWIFSADGEWYRPYLIWVLVIIVAYIVQGRKKNHDL